MEKKTLIIAGSSIIGLLVVILIGVWAISIFSTHYKTYEEAEEYITEAAKKYYKNRPGELPSSDGEYTITYQKLVDAGYAQPLSEILEDASSCSISINLIKQDNSYNYFTYLNCGDKYSTQELYKKILNDNPVVTSGKGIYQSEDGTYYFRGKVTNNYVSFGSYKENKETINLLWRIISIKDGIVKLKAVDSIGDYYWDKQYNSTTKSRDGYNIFDTSTLSDSLTKLVNKKNFLDEEKLSYLVLDNICVGSRTKTDVSRDGSTECSVLSTNKYYFSTILPYEYIRASLDENCDTLNNNACTNQNYLYRNQSSEWTTTPSSLDNCKVYSFTGSIFTLNVANYDKALYPVIKMNKYALFNDGDGTKDNPYTIK